MDPITTTFWQTLMALLFGAAPVHPSPPPPLPPAVNGQVYEITIGPSEVTCTDMACIDGECCNACNANSWTLTRFPRGLSTFPSQIRFDDGVTPPVCSLDGCGQGCLEGETRASIRVDGDAAVVLSWSR